MRFKDIFATSDDTQSLGNKFRNKRIADFRSKIESLTKPLNILDVGGLESFWVNGGFADDPDYNISILNLNEIPVHYSNFTSLIGDATFLHEFKDGEFDIVFSNSVIEHLYTKENQIKMASEICRVGKSYYVQTPNKHFFVEPHYLLPFFQYLPANLKYFILTKTPLSRRKKWNKAEAQQYIDEIRLLSLSEMKELFPEADFYMEEFYGMIKSFTAHNFIKE
ncbi:Methyltransferase domain-containing protein [Daejeonella rubra]|uniref:Methyltransferase domain-containing protein n=1 Tax=Daejeonella rubra TaxID=990371 RepID=A0A1G9Y6V8_9SPHI|nr:class I SAM-dependent methyltransferase [Daejeonella rubra]SDN04809.1 Methyltransferase domain-containing protein [Daejeonella rubra]